MTNDGTYLTPEELAQLKEAFRAQTKELLEDFSARALELETAAERGEVFQSMARILHTIKGDSMALEFASLSKMAHRLEDYLRSLRGADTISRGEIDVLLECSDRMGELLDAYCSEPRTAIPEIEMLCGKLVPRIAAETREMNLEGSFYQLTVWFADDCLMHSAGAFLVRRRLAKLAKIASCEPDPETPEIEESTRWEVVVESSTSVKELRRAARVPGVTSRVVLKKVARRENVGADRAREGGDSSNEAVKSASIYGGASEQLRVEVGKIDRIMNLVGELVIGRSMVTQSLTELRTGEVVNAVSDRLVEANSFLERTLTELQAAVLKIRMVPVEHVFRRFPRLVRDLAHSRDKHVDLDVRGGLTEFDKSIVVALGEPLLHLVRNAVDHGLESREERGRAGKPEAGRLMLSAFYEGNHVHIVVEDDGRGIDVAQVAERAVQLGILDPGQLDNLSPSDILNTIYQPGFSTKETVSNVSGRGIGMDVVRESIENLKGVIELESAPGRGTRFLIRLPLTLAILRAVLVEVSNRAFAVPLSSVLEIVRLRSDQADSVLGRGVLHWRDQVVPLIELRDSLGLSSDGRPDGGFVLLVGEAERRVGLVADRLLGEQELVVKPIEDGLTRSPGIAGASILGNGRVVLILHTRGLLDKHVSLSRRVEVLR